jgi:hypothetical protein
MSRHVETNIVTRLTRAPALLAVLLMPLVASVVGCGSSGGSSSALNNAQFAFLAEGGTVPQAQQYLFAATQELTRRCMTAKGFQYIPAHMAPPQPLAAANNELNANGRAPSESVQLLQREKVGYGIYESLLPYAKQNGEASAPANDIYVRTLSSARQKQYMISLEGEPSQRAQATPPGGTPYTYVTGGCLARVNSELYGSPGVANAVVSTPQAVREQLVTATESDPSVVAEKLSWSRCIQQSTGHSFANPPAVAGWLSRQYSARGVTTGLRRLEISLATADTRCAYTTGLAQGYAATFRHRADHLSATLQGTLLLLLEDDKKAALRAEVILGHQG